MRRLVEHYNVTYVISGLTRKWYNITDESYLSRIYEGGNYTVYKVTFQT